MNPFCEAVEQTGMGRNFPRPCSEPFVPGPWKCSWQGEDPKESSIRLHMGSDLQAPGSERTMVSVSTEGVPKLVENQLSLSQAQTEGFYFTWTFAGHS